MTRTQLITLLRSTAASQETLHHVMHVWKDEKAQYMQMDRLFEICCMCTGITVEQGKEKFRNRPRVRARQLFCYIGRDWYTVTDMGRFMGGRDHTTSIHARDTAIDLYKIKDDVFMFDLENVHRGMAGLEMKPLPLRFDPDYERKITLIHDIESDIYYRTVKSLSANYGLRHKDSFLKLTKRLGAWRFKYKTFTMSETAGFDIL